MNGTDNRPNKDPAIIELLERLRPYKVRPASDELPGRWETGTQNHEGLAGLLGAYEYLADLGGSTAVERQAFEAAMQRIQAHEQALAARLIGGLGQIRGVQELDACAPKDGVPLADRDQPPHPVEERAGDAPLGLHVDRLPGVARVDDQW